MIAVNVIERRRSGVHIVHHGDGQIVQPDIFAQRLPGGVGLGDDVIADVVDIERRRAGRRRYSARRPPIHRVIAIDPAIGCRTINHLTRNRTHLLSK